MNEWDDHLTVMLTVTHKIFSICKINDDFSPLFFFFYFLFIDTLDDSLRSQTTKTMKNYNLGFFFDKIQSLYCHMKR